MTEKVKETSPEEEIVDNTAPQVDAEATVAQTEEGSAEISEQEDQQDVTEPTIESFQDELKAAQAEAAKNLEGWQRTAADLANYKRRQEEQAGRRRLDITASIIRDILPALDDLDLAFQNLPNTLNENEVSWVEGFKLVQRKLLKMLEKNNIQIINTEGEFDPNLHEAVTHEESPDHDSNLIIAELRKGYKIGDRILRPALVRVAQ